MNDTTRTDLSRAALLADRERRTHEAKERLREASRRANETPEPALAA